LVSLITKTKLRLSTGYVGVSVPPWAGQGRPPPHVPLPCASPRHEEEGHGGRSSKPPLSNTTYLPTTKTKFIHSHELKMDGMKSLTLP
jgi:hypothetical protein